MCDIQSGLSESIYGINFQSLIALTLFCLKPLSIFEKEAKIDLNWQDRLGHMYLVVLLHIVLS
jgi:hypothetical protein